MRTFIIVTAAAAAVELMKLRVERARRVEEEMDSLLSDGVRIELTDGRADGRTVESISLFVARG